MVADCEALAVDIRPTLYEALRATSASLTCRTRDVRLLPRLTLPFEGQTAEMGDRRFLAERGNSSMAHTPRVAWTNELP